MVRLTSRMTPALALFAAALAMPAAASAQTFTVQKYDIKGVGGTDYLTAEPGTGRVFVSRSSHVMVVNGLTGAVLGDIPDTPRHARHRARDEGRLTASRPMAAIRRSTMFDLKDLHVIKKVHAGVNGLDGIMYDDFTQDDPLDQPQHAGWNRRRGQCEDRRRGRQGRAERERAGRRRERRQGKDLHQHREQEFDRRHRRQDVDQGRDVGHLALRRPDGHRDGSQDEPHFRRLQRHVGRG